MADDFSPFEVLGFGNEVGLDTKHASPPVNAYIGVDDQLGIDFSSSTAGINVTVYARVLLPNGNVVPCQWNFFTLAQRTPSSQTFPLPEGFLLSLTVGVFALLGTGSLFVKAYLAKAAQANIPISQVLCSGYVSTENTLSWPGSGVRQTSEGRGLIRMITGAVPAAGAEISETVPANTLWRLESFKYQWTTSAAVATRGNILSIDNGTSIIHQTAYLTALTAGQGRAYFYSIGADNRATPNGFDSLLLPNYRFMMPGWRIRTITSSMDVADQYSAIFYTVEEWTLG
jgi:hypothetical protein